MITSPRFYTSMSCTMPVCAHSSSRCQNLEVRLQVLFLFIVPGGSASSVSIVGTLLMCVDLKGMPLTFHVLVSFISMNWGKGSGFLFVCLFV